MWQKSFHLRWNNHLQNLRTLFENLYNEQDFVDVTISCSDGLLHAHKLVLSACSPYFETVFKENPCKHPTLILKGIKRQEMQTLLEYMYVGSVDVHEDDLEILLSIANELHVKGLVNKKESETKVSKTKNIAKFNKKALIKDQPPAMKEPVTLWQAELTAKNAETEHKQPSSPTFGAPIVKVEAVNFMEHNNQVTKSLKNVTDTVENLPPVIKEEILEEHFDETIEESDDIMEGLTNRSLEFCDVSVDQEECGILEKNVVIADDGFIVCHICNRSFQNKPSYRRHMQTHTGEKPHQCSYCEQSFLRLSHLQRHIRVHTGERPYACSQCPKHFSRSDKLKQHLVIHHSGLAGKICKPRGRPRKEVSDQSSSSLYNLGRDFSMYLNNVSVSSTCSNLNSGCSDVAVNL